MPAGALFFESLGTTQTINVAQNLQNAFKFQWKSMLRISISWYGRPLEFWWQYNKKQHFFNFGENSSHPHFPSTSSLRNTLIKNTWKAVFGALRCCIGTLLARLGQCFFLPECPPKSVWFHFSSTMAPFSTPQRLKTPKWYQNDSKMIPQSNKN